MAVDVTLLNSNSLDNIQSNFERVEEALQDSLSRSGTTPNQMDADFDMNSNDILNAGNIDANTLVLDGVTVSPYGQQGWTPIHAAVTYGGDIVFQLVDYIGGNGLKPTQYIGWYLGSDGYVEDIDDATNFGSTGVTDGNKGDIIVSSGGSVWRLARKFKTISELVADTAMTYSNVTAGQSVEAAEVKYEVAASDASNQHLTTAGGVKLYVLNTKVTPEMFGAVGDDTTNDQAALVRAFTYATDITISKQYSIEDYIFISNKPNLRITANAGAKITYRGVAHNWSVFWFNGVNSFILDGALELDCNSKTNAGLVIVGIDGCDLVHINGLISRNMVAATGFSSGAGIRVSITGTGVGNICHIQNVQFYNTTRTDDALPLQVLTVTEFREQKIENFIIDGVRRNATGIDCDGIAAFQNLVSGQYERGNISIGPGIIKNTSGRFVKVQSRGWSEVHSLTCVNDDVTLPYLASGGIYSIDMQTGGGSVRDIQMDFEAPTIGTISTMEFVKIGLNAQAPYTGAPVILQVKDVNVSYAGGTKTVERGITVNLLGLATAAYQAIVDIDSNHMVKTTGWGNGAVCTRAIDLQVPASFAAGSYAVVNISNNTIDSSIFMQNFPEAPGGVAAHNGAGDLSAFLELHIENNGVSSTSTMTLLPYASNECFTSRIRVSGNSVGIIGSRWDAPFDFAEILPGCDFLTGGGATPASINGPAVFNNSRVSFVGRKIVDPAVLATYISGTGASTTWTTRTYT